MFKNKLITFSNDGNYLAICNAEGILKLWDTNANVLEHEFHPGEHLSSEVTCLKISIVDSLKNLKGTKKKKNVNIAFSRTSNILIALGTIEGTILIYNPGKQEVTKKLVHAPTSPVTDLYWDSSQNLVSIGDNKKLIIWNLKSQTPLCTLDITETKSLCILSENHYVTGKINLQCLSYDPETKQTTGYTIPGHKTTIAQLVPIVFNGKNTSYFLSSAENDRFVYVWAVNSELREPLGSFMVNDIVRTVNCISMDDSSILVAVTTQKGILRIFHHHLNGSKNKQPIRFQKSLQVESSSKRLGLLTILAAAFISTTDILIVYGTELFPRMERRKLDTITMNTILSRQDPSVFTRNKESNLVKNVTPHVPVKAVHLMPTQMNPTEMKEVSGKRKKGGVVANLPMEERLDALSLTQALPGAADSRPLDNYIHLLIQALHSKDSNLMNSILAKGDDEAIINNTVRRLPVSYIVPFLQYLQEVITGKGLKNLTCINWIKSVLFHHMSHLSSVPKKENLLQPFYSVFAARTTSFVAVSKLHARISLLLTQVKNRHENTTQTASDSQAEALYKYKDESSDEEDARLEMDGGPSESEDIWDDWTEEEVEEEDELEEDASKRKRGTEKRKLSSSDKEFLSMNVSGGEDGDETEDVEDENDDSGDDDNDDSGDNDNDDIESLSESE